MLDASNPFFTDVAQGIELAAEGDGLSLFLCNSGQRSERESAHLDLLQQHRVRGILITPVDPDSDRLDEIREHGTPVVIVDRIRGDASFCSVAVDDVLGGRIAVEHLLDRGHTARRLRRRPVQLGQVGDRLPGAREAWADAGLPGTTSPCSTTEALTVAAVAGRRAAAGWRARRGAHGGVLRQRPARPRPAAAGDRGRPASPATSRSSATTTSSSPARRRPADLGTPAAPGARAPRRAAARRADQPGPQPHAGQFTPELVARASTLG